MTGTQSALKLTTNGKNMSKDEAEAIAKLFRDMLHDMSSALIALTWIALMLSSLSFLLVVVATWSWVTQ